MDLILHLGSPTVRCKLERYENSTIYWSNHESTCNTDYIDGSTLYFHIPFFYCVPFSALILSVVDCVHVVCTSLFSKKKPVNKFYLTSNIWYEINTIKPSPPKKGLLGLRLATPNWESENNIYSTTLALAKQCKPTTLNQT